MIDYSTNVHFKNIIALIKNVAASKSTILLTGESGVGKEQLAKYIHDQSSRKNESFVAVNCAAIPAELLESELFGYEKGAFTGASHSRIGKIESAHGGTFLLDEISEIPFDLQAKLLRVIQEKEIVRLGSNELKKVDVRFICTSNKDLKEMVKNGKFRNDLYYRINVVPVRIPSLKERFEDIPTISQQIIEKICSENGFGNKKLDEAALSKLKKWNWPGNIRELQNVLERSVLVSSNEVLSPDEILIEGFDESRVQIFGPGMTVNEAEKLLIFKTLEHTQQNRTQAAKLLGISIRTLRNKMNEYKNNGEVIYESDV